MKLAIIGSGPLALEAAAHFHGLGASIKIFTSQNIWGGGILRLENSYDLLTSDWSKLVTSAGRELCGYTEEVNSGDDYLRYLNHMGHALRENGLVKDGQVKRVHKRFLKPGNTPKDKSRLADLFRVVYQIDSTEQIEKQRQENAEVFEKLGKEVVESLKNSIESFEDFDLVIDASGLTNKPMYMGASNSAALNEQALVQGEDLFYGREVLKGLDNISDKTSLITFVGTGPYNLFALSKVKEHFLKKKNCKIQLITDEEVPFLGLDTDIYAKGLSGFQSLLEEDQQDFRNLIEEFEKRIIEWKELESHVRAKTPRPAEPTPRLFVFNGAVVSSVDRLLDQKGIFITIEGSELIGTGDQLKTLSSNIVFVDNGFYKDESLNTGLNTEDEPGHFTLKETNIKKAHERILNIEKEIMKYFSRA